MVKLMKNSQSIKKLVLLFVLIACSLLVISYSVLVNIFFEKGLVLAVQHRLELESSAYASAYEKDKSTSFPDAANFKTFPDYKGLPSEIKEKVGPDFPAGEFDIVHSVKNEDKYHFIYSWERSDGKVLYFVYTIGDADKSELILSTLHGIAYYTIATGLILFLGIILVALFIIRRITKLVMKLTDWAVHLNNDNVENPIGDFQYTELNQLAVLFQRNMRRQLAGIQREQKFLRNASHELRTPVAVLQSNLDWLNRLGVDEEEKFKRPLSSMEKAVNNMKELITTLLWINKKDIDSMPKHEIKVDDQLQNIIDDNSYLLTNKNVHVRAELLPQVLSAPETLARIVWSNIIRNSFQHTYQGEINISLSVSVLTVTNDLIPDATDSISEGFGLGLMLIQDLTDSLGWELTVNEQSTSYSVMLRMD